MSGVLRLVLFQARRDRVTLPIWIAGIALLGFATSTAVATQFADEASRAAIVQLAGPIRRSSSFAVCRLEPG